MTGAHTVIEKEGKYEIFDKVRGFAHQMMKKVDSVLSNVRKEPAEDRFDHGAGVVGRKRVSGKYGDQDGPEKRWPPRTEPMEDWRFRRTWLVEAGDGFCSSPGFREGHEKIGSNNIVNEG